MRRGGMQYQLALSKLERDHNCKIFECFEHPQNLKAVLRDVYGKECQKIVDEIGFELADVIDEKEVSGFLKKIR